MNTMKTKKPIIKLDKSFEYEMLGHCFELYNKTSDITKKYGLIWYNDATKFAQSLANKFGLEFDVVNHCLCVLSNANEWNSNKLDCERMIDAFMNGRSIDSFKVKTYGRDKRKAWNVLKNNIRIQPNSLKTYSFAMNIANIDNHYNVTIDRHMLSAMLTREYGSLTENKYSIFRDCIIKFAKCYNIEPRQMQAILWLQIKIDKGQLTEQQIHDLYTRKREVKKLYTNMKTHFKA